MAPAASQQEYADDLAKMGVETATWPADSLWRRGLAIRAEVQQFKPELVLLDGVKLPPGALMRLAVRLAVLGASVSAIDRRRAHSFVEAHPGIAVEPSSPQFVLVPQVWHRHWYPPLENLGSFGIPEGGFTVGGVATHADCLQWLVEAGHWLPLDLPIHFLVVVPAAARRQLRRTVLGTMLAQRYHFCDALAQAPALLASCNLTVLSSDEPIQRASTLNGIYHGVPLISRLSGTSVPFALPAQNAEQLAAQVLELYEDRDRYAALAAAGRQFGEQDRGAEALARALVAHSE